MKQPWIYSRGVDGAFILAPALVVTAVVLLLQQSISAMEAMPLWMWGVLIVGVDVAHVYSTLFRTYADADEFKARRNLYVLAPLICWAVGTLPFTASTSGTMGGWMRFSNESSDCQVGHLLALADAWPPSVLPMFKTVAPISTLTWTVEFLSNHFQVLGSDWWQYLADADASANGYAHIGAKIWDKNSYIIRLDR